MHLEKNEAVLLAKLINMKSQDVLSIWKKNLNKKEEFVYLKRSLSPDIAQQIKSLHLPGVYLQQEMRRYFPEGEVDCTYSWIYEY